MLSSPLSSTERLVSSIFSTPSPSSSPDSSAASVSTLSPTPAVLAARCSEVDTSFVSSSSSATSLSLFSASAQGWARQQPELQPPSSSLSSLSSSSSLPPPPP